MTTDYFCQPEQEDSEANMDSSMPSDVTKHLGKQLLSTKKSMVSICHNAIILSIISLQANILCIKH